MGIFARLAALLKSNLNDLISSSEDPEKMLNQIVLDMSNQLLEAKRQVAASIADEKRLAKQVEQETANATEWERRAMLAVRSGDDALAKEALARKKDIKRWPSNFKNSGRSKSRQSISSSSPCALSTTRSKKPSARRTC
ncbi:MAG: PspA/IM30 family protein [Pseudomonadota bacterium]